MSSGLCPCGWVHTKGSKWRCAKYLEHTIAENNKNKNDPSNAVSTPPQHAVMCPKLSGCWGLWKRRCGKRRQCWAGNAGSCTPAAANAGRGRAGNGEKPQRGGIATPGWNKGKHRVWVRVGRQSERENTSEWGGGYSSNDGTRGCCRVLDLAGG